MLRLFVILFILLIGGSFLAYIFTGQRRFLARAWLFFRAGLVFGLIVVALTVSERFAIVPW